MSIRSPEAVEPTHPTHPINDHPSGDSHVGHPQGHPFERISEQEYRRLLAFNQCRHEGNVTGLKYTTGTGLGMLAAHYIATRTSQLYRNKIETTGKALTFAGLCYAVFYTASFYAQKNCMLRRGTSFVQEGKVVQTFPSKPKDEFDSIKRWEHTKEPTQPR